MRGFACLMIVLSAITIDYGYVAAGSQAQRNSGNSAMFESHTTNRLFENSVTQRSASISNGEQACQDTAPECSGPAEPHYGDPDTGKPVPEKGAGSHAHQTDRKIDNR
jgi:hypothetical protein